MKTKVKNIFTIIANICTFAAVTISLLIVTFITVEFVYEVSHNDDHCAIVTVIKAKKAEEIMSEYREKMMEKGYTTYGMKNTGKWTVEETFYNENTNNITIELDWF